MAGTTAQIFSLNGNILSHLPPKSLDAGTRDTAHSVDLSGIDTWVFDLDNTLYSPRCDLFGQIDVRMKAYIARLLDIPPDEARVVQKRYFQDHGTTLRGLMDWHHVKPADFLDFVHDIDLSVLSVDSAMAASLARLPGRRLVFTNGDAPYARRVLDALALSSLFEGVHDIYATEFVPKPGADAYSSLLGRYGIDPARALFVEDMARNLAPAKALGMTTVWVNNGSEKGADGAHPAFIDIEIDDVSPWLQAVADQLKGDTA